MKDAQFELEWASVYTFSCQRMDALSPWPRAVRRRRGARRVAVRRARRQLRRAGRREPGLEARRGAAAAAPATRCSTATPPSASTRPTRTSCNSTRATDFITPKSEISRLFRDAVLQLAREHAVRARAGQQRPPVGAGHAARLAAEHARRRCLRRRDGARRAGARRAAALRRARRLAAAPCSATAPSRALVFDGARQPTAVQALRQAAEGLVPLQVLLVAGRESVRLPGARTVVDCAGLIQRATTARPAPPTCCGPTSTSARAGARSLDAAQRACARAGAALMRRCMTRDHAMPLITAPNLDRRRRVLRGADRGAPRPERRAEPRAECQARAAAGQPRRRQRRAERGTGRCARQRAARQRHQGMTMNDSDLHYQSGFGNEFASEAVPGALPQGRNSPQQAPHGPVRRAAVGHRVHRAARDEPPHLDVPPPAVGGERRLCAVSAAAVDQRRGRRRRHAARPAALEPVCDPRRAARFHRRPAHDRRQRRRARRRPAWPRTGLHRQPLDGAGARWSTPMARCCSCRSRAACASPPSSAAATWRRARSRWCRAAWRFEVELPDGPSRGYVCENYGAPFSPARAGADRLQRPGQCARLSGAGGRARGRRRRRRGGRKFGGRLWRSDAGRHAVQRGGLARQPGAVASTTPRAS